MRVALPCSTPRCKRPAATRHELHRLLEETCEYAREGRFDLPTLTTRVLIITMRFDRCSNCIKALVGAAWKDAQTTPAPATPADGIPIAKPRF